MSPVPLPPPREHFCKSCLRKVYRWPHVSYRLYSISHLQVQASDGILNRSYNSWTFCQGLIRSRGHFIGYCTCLVGVQTLASELKRIPYHTLPRSSMRFCTTNTYIFQLQRVPSSTHRAKIPVGYLSQTL